MSTTTSVQISINVEPPQLPVELWGEVFLKLENVHHILKPAFVCKMWFEACNASLWKKLHDFSTTYAGRFRIVTPNKEALTLRLVCDINIKAQAYFETPWACRSQVLIGLPTNLDLNQLLAAVKSQGVQFGDGMDFLSRIRHSVFSRPDSPTQHLLLECSNIQGTAPAEAAEERQ